MTYMPVNSQKPLSELLNLITEILRDSDPRCVELELSGYKMVGESWGARLHLHADDDLGIYSNAVDLALKSGVELQELGSGFANALLTLELVNNPDYPYTPATFHDVPTIESIRALWRSGNRIFGALSDGVLVGAVCTSSKEERVEIDFASLLREYRGRGIGKALVAAAIVAWEMTGVRIFTTGGAAQNAASLGTVLSLGFTAEEKWRSYQISN